MLLLTRRIGETITIGADIRVTICAVNGGQVRIGIEAPAAVAVDREEIALKKRLNPLPPSAAVTRGDAA